MNADPTRSHLSEPEHLGRYRLLQKLGEGGMGIVWLAHDEKLDRRVAVKVLPAHSVADPDAMARFQREARALAKLSHPGIVQAFDADAVGEQQLLVMEYVEGESLGRQLKKQGRITPAIAADYIHQVAQALQHAHEKGLIHRDLKPSNLLVTKDRQIKILDLGLARFLQDQVGDPNLTHEGRGMGTPDYVAPEQVRSAHHVDARADIYSLGCTLYHLLTGQVPFPGSSLSEKFRAHEIREPAAVEKLCPEIPGGLALVVQRMMAKRPEDRFQTAREVAEALAPYAAAPPRNFPVVENTVSWQTSQPIQADQRPGLKRRRWVVSGVVAVAVAALSLLWILLPLATTLDFSGFIPWGQPREVELEITTVPPGATVILDKQPQTQLTNGIFSLTPGKHRLRLELAGYRSLEEDIDVAAKDPTPLKYELQVYTRPIEIRSTPDGANVSIDDGKYTGVTNKTFELPLGKFKIVISKPGYRKIEDWLTVKEGDDIHSEEYVLVLDEVSIKILTNPPGARVFIDGKLRSPVGPDTYKVAPGKRQVRLELDDKHYHVTKTIEVTGRSDRATYKFELPRILLTLKLLTVQTVPTDVEVCIDGRPQQPNPDGTYPLTVGDHTVEVLKEGFEAKPLFLQVRPDLLLAVQEIVFRPRPVQRYALLVGVNNPCPIGIKLS